MFALKRLIGSSLFVFVLAATALAQESRAPIDNPREPVPTATAAPLVTATATAKRVRFVMDQPSGWEGGLPPPQVARATRGNALTQAILRSRQMVFSLNMGP